jgi:hypothetical protein
MKFMTEVVDPNNKPRVHKDMQRIVYHAGSWRQSSNAICNMGDGPVAC